ncbi:flagellin [Pseudoduganella danionis]|uniref:Flagellin n=1 Tax=Pseudoduganella danionis TaxID=1890295 RepID=A0ABW9SGW6_9BURK|nr:flagellin [Pseudoduganella danionis]MTW31263.1 flagellin [Pseudoduganella danionis]
MQLNTNLSALNAQRSLNAAGEDMLVRFQKLASGQRINSARDDAAGQAIGERMTSGVNGLRRARQNINDGISLLQVADGAAGQLLNNFQRMRELAVQAANDINSTVDRQAIQTEVNALAVSNRDIVDGARYNNTALLDGTFSTQLQIGSEADQTLLVAISAALVKDGYNRSMIDMAQQQASAVGTTVVGALRYGDLVINNSVVQASVADALPGQSADSAYAVAAAINRSNVTNVSATATASSSGTVGSSGALGDGDLIINGVSIGAISGNTAAARAANAAGAISAAAGSSGVSASAVGDTLTLTAADGRNIIIAESNAGTAASLGLSLGTTRGSVTVTEAARAGSHSMRIGGTNPSVVGLNAGAQASVRVGPIDMQPKDSFIGGEPLQDMLTFSGASDAMDYYDSKIDEITNIRSQLGAMSNRLSEAAANADNGATNLAAARSRIVDTDYASETAQLTRSRILRAAGTSMLAQANTQPRRALQLLR